MDDVRRTVIDKSTRLNDCQVSATSEMPEMRTAEAVEAKTTDLPVPVPMVLDAKHVYLLMKKEYRISRNVRAQWFFTNLNKDFSVAHHDSIEEFEDELSVISVIPCETPPQWCPESAHEFKYRLLPSSVITFLARRYRLVFCLDLSPSVMVVDAKSGEVVLDSMMASLRKCLEGVTAEFIVPGSCLRFVPQLYVTVIAHSSSFLCPNQQVVVQGWRLTYSNLNAFLSLVVHHVMGIENFLAGCISYLQQRSSAQRVHNSHSTTSGFLNSSQLSSDKSIDFLGDEDDSTSCKSRGSLSSTSTLKSPETGFIDLLRYGILALQLLPDNTSAGIVVVTDGVINVPDIHVFQSLLTQLRNSTISCSFLHVGSSREPRCCWGYAPFTDLMRFISTATYGAYISHATNVDNVGNNDDKLLTMNIYHQGMFCWSFQWAPYMDKVVCRNVANVSQNGTFPFNGTNFSTKDDFHFETKKHTEKNIATPLQTLLSCRLREGYAVQHISVVGNRLEVSMMLPWKHDVNINYVTSSTWPPDSSLCHYKVVVKGSYEFLHDLTCPTKKPIKSVHRSSVVKKFFEALQQLSQTDDLLTHLHSFASNPVYYMIPESARNNVPLFYLPNGSSRPVCCSDFLSKSFAEFWEPICLLDINIWQKWMHAHRIGLLLAHDRPLSRHLHAPNSNGRYTTVQCRQALAALDTILADFSSFVLVENHSYIKLMFGYVEAFSKPSIFNPYPREPDKPPTSFVIIRVISQAPCMVIRLAFLGGTPSRNRIQIVDELRIKILALTSPSRGNLKTASNSKTNSVTEGGSTSDITIGLVEGDNIAKRTPCCIPLLKPVEKLLIRYERTPADYTNPSERHTRQGMTSFAQKRGAKTSTMLSILGNYLHHRRWVWSAQCDSSVILSMNVISRILATLVKMRLQKGFHFAHSHSGIINLVLEIQMKVSNGSDVEEDELYPCVMQYILFPPHVARSSPESLSEDEQEIEQESGEASGELQLITECWVEPQHGCVARTSTYGSETGDLEGLPFRELPKALFNIDLECISTMLTFEHLNVMCSSGASFIHLQNSDSVHPKATTADRQLPTWSSCEDGDRASPVRHVPFPYNLTRLLTRCPQAQLLFSTLTQDSLSLTTSTSCRGDMANELFMGLFHDGLSSIHDREVPLSTAECLLLPSLLRPECRVDQSPVATADLNSQPMKKTSEGGTIVAKWRCYIKCLSPTHIILTFVPDTFGDLCLLGRGVSSGHDVRREKLPASRSLHGRRYDISVYVVDCSLWRLIADMVAAESIFRVNEDFFQDYRCSHRDSENLDDVRSRKSSENMNDVGGMHLNLLSPEPRTEDSEEVASSPSDRRHWTIHAGKVATVYSNCFVSTIYRCLRKKIAVGRSDILSSMEEVCFETALEIDISEFLQTICLHVSGSAAPHAQKKTLDADAECSTENVTKKVLSVPNQVDLFGPCLSLRRIHAIIQSKFAALMEQSFSPVPANPDYYYYDPPSQNNLSHSVKSNAASRPDDLNDDDGDGIQFATEEENIESNNAMLDFGTDLDSDDDHRTESSDDFDEDGSSSVAYDSNNEKRLSRDFNGSLPPLFVHLTCSISDQQSSLVANCSVKTLPTCFGDLKDSLLEFGWSGDVKVDLNHIRVTLDVLCLTLPPEVEESLDRQARDPVEEQPSRSISLCSSTVKPGSEDDEDLCTVDGYDKDVLNDPLGHLPVCQRQAVNGCVTEIKWMLKDEIASFARGLNPITESVLDSVTNHVRQSTSLARPGCLATHVPLHFVFGPENSLDKFVQEFQHMKLRGYRLISEGRYYYVALSGSSHVDSVDTLGSSIAIGHAGGDLVAQNPHQDDGKELDATVVRRASGSCSVDDLMTTPTFALSRSLAADRCASCEDSDAEDGSLYNDRRADVVRKRMQARLARTRGNRSKSESELGNFSDSNRSSFETRLRWRSRFKAVSLREESPPCTTVGDDDDDDEETIIDVEKNLSALLSNDTEDGYDGDSSDDDTDGMLLCDSDSKIPQLPDFWLIMELLPDRVDVYFQFRDAEICVDNLHSHQDINSQLVNNIKSMCKLVNQALLLRDLHETRMCNQLLEPEASEDIWRAEEISSPSPMAAIMGSNVSIADATARKWSAYQSFSESVGEQEDDVDCQDTYLEATMKFMPGAFACPVVWQMQFFLHPRLKTGHGRTSISRGVQALKSVLSRLSVNNRKNMFVYKERTGGAVFYLRLHELPSNQGLFSVCSGGIDASVLQQEVGILRQTTVDESGSFGGSQSSSMQSLNVSRNPLVDGNDDLPEPRSRVNSMPEKDRIERADLHFQHSHLDSMSVTSRISGRQRSVIEDVISLSVHGITEAGPEIKEELVEALQGRLDDAILDVISITLARNPMCKLTMEDVQFIQKPDSVPNDVRHFMVCSQALPHLPVVVYYLQQNLLQFLNIPKYVDNRDGSHFQRYRKNPEITDPEHPGVFLYIMPQEAGSRGIACIVLSVVDGRGNLVCHLDCPRPNPDTHQDGFSMKDFDELTFTLQHLVEDEPSKKYPGPVALIQIQIWIKGKVDVEQLVYRLQVAIRHALWDLITEYRLLTAPLSELPADGDCTSTPASSEPCTPIQRIKHHSARQSIAESAAVRERAASPLFLVQAMLREVSISVPDLVAKCRSPTCSSARGADAVQTKSPPPVTDNEVYFAMDADVFRRREKYEVGEKGSLHLFYALCAESWLEYGRQIGVPSVERHSLVLKSRYSVQIVLHDIYKLIAKLVPDTTPRTFIRERPSSDNFVPFLVTGRERRKASGGSLSSETYRNLPGTHCDYLVVGRNVRQWRASTGRIDDDIIESADYKNYKDVQRYSPQIHSLSSEAKDDATGKKVFIPRQRLLLITIRDCEISLFTYNWAHDLATSLVEESSKMVELQNRRSCLLSSIVMQKLGLFLNQPGTRQCTGEGMCKAAGGGEEYKCLKCSDIESLLKGIGGGGGLVATTGGLGGSRRDLNLQFPHRPRRSASSSHHHSIPFCDVLRDAKPLNPMQQPQVSSATDPVLRHGLQFQEIRNADNRELQKQLVSTWQNREGRICVQRLKQISRVEHYCLTPILFHPAWRLQVAAARDHTRTCTPITEQSSHSSGVHLHHHHHHQHNHHQQHQHIQLSSSGPKSRHSSGTSMMSSDMRPSKRSLADFNSTGGTGFSSAAAHVSGEEEPKVTLASNSDEWHAKMYSAYVAEFVQYLQTLGFVGFRSPRTQKSSKCHVGKSDVASSDDKDACLSSSTSQYLQKILLGGILLLELVFCEPYFGVKMYTLESVRLRALSNRVQDSQFVVAFLDECDKIKVCMHLHSFTYDYHLRSVHSYVCGRQVPGLGRDYHVLGFLDDFVQYYIKSPNFARNLVHQGSMNVGPTTGTTTRQLFNYLLKYDKLYEMRAVKMHVGIGREGGAEDEVEHLLVQMSTHKVAFRDSISEARQTDEFDMSLLISVDASRCDSLATNNSLNLRYYIILTSCREMYPKPVAEKQPGTFRPVITPCVPLVPTRSLATPPLRVSGSVLDEMETSQDPGPISDSSLSQPAFGSDLGSSGSAGVTDESLDRRHPSICEETTIENSLEQSTEAVPSSVDRRDRRKTISSCVGSIRQEVVNYLGYFSSHEELMHKIIMEQVDEARSLVEKIVHKAVVDCRRDSLWERLQRGGGDVEVADPRRRRDDSKEFNCMSYAEFMDLLSLVDRKPLTAVDGRLAAFAVMPVSWYQTLVRVLLNKYHDLRRHHFTAPDGNIQHLVILSASPSNWFILLSIDLHSNSTELCVVCRDKSAASDFISCTAVHSLVEDVVNVCCFHMWTVLL